MSIANALVLDHFYVAVSEEDFVPLTELAKLIRVTIHSKMETKDDAYEGIYMYSRTMAYFEMLREKKTGGLGLCFSPFYVQYADASKIVEEMPHEKWKTKTQYWTDGTPWYDSHTTADYPSFAETLFHPWVMKYHPQHTDYTGFKGRPRQIDRFERLHLTVGRENLAEIEKNSSWLPCVKTFGEKSIRFEISDREFSTFVIDVDLIDGNSRFEFKELLMKGCDPALEALDGHRMGSFHLDVKGDRVRLKKLKAQSFDGKAF